MALSISGETIDKDFLEMVKKLQEITEDEDYDKHFKTIGESINTIHQNSHNIVSLASLRKSLKASLNPVLQPLDMVVSTIEANLTQEKFDAIDSLMELVESKPFQAALESFIKILNFSFDTLAGHVERLYFVLKIFETNLGGMPPPLAEQGQPPHEDAFKDPEDEQEPYMPTPEKDPIRDTKFGGFM